MTAPDRWRGTERWKIKKGCTDKRRFSDEITARVGAQIQCQNDHKPAMWVYPCDFCKGWHITNKVSTRKLRVTAEAPYPPRNEPDPRVRTPQFGGFWGGKA